MSLIKNSAHAAGAAVLLAGSRFAITSILARKLAPEMFGHFVYVQWSIELIILIFSLGHTGAASRFIAEHRGANDRVDGFLMRWRPWAIGLPSVAGVCAVVVLFISGLRLDLGAWVMLAVWSSAGGFWAMQTAALTGFQRFDLILQSNLLGAAIPILGAAILPVESNLGLLFGIMALGSAVAASRGLMQTWAIRQKSTTKISVRDWGLLRRYAINTWIISLIGALLWTRGELPVVRQFLGDTGVARYAAASTLFAGAMQGVSLGIAAVIPSLTQLWGANRSNDTLNMAKNIAEAQLILAGLAACTLEFFGSSLIRVAFGQAYVNQSFELSILSFGLISAALNSQNHLLQLATDGRFIRNLSVFGLGLLILLAYGFIPTFGVRGAVVARVATMLILSGISLICFRRKWGRETLPLSNFWRVFAILLVVLIVKANFEFASLVNGLLFAITSIALIFCVRDKANGSKILLLLSYLPRFRTVK